jgi:hypothetical protein
MVWKRQKRMEDNFARSKAAYDIILNKEFAYYEKIDAIYADLIPRIHDIIDSLANDSSLALELLARQEQVKENFVMFLESIPRLKKEYLMYDIYLPETVRKTNLLAITEFQSSLDFMSNETKKLFGGNESEIDIIACRETLDVLLSVCAAARGSILFRLQVLANPKKKLKG